MLYEDGREENLGGGVYKGGAAYFDRLFPIAGDRQVKAVRIEAWGYGGIGFTWLETIQQGKRRVPVEITRQSGIVADAEHLLVDDFMWCFMGEHHINPLMEEQPARVHHVLEVKLGQI